MKDFFTLAIVGPMLSRRLGVASGCMECREKQDHAPRCDGFGSGCLGFRSVSREERERREDE